MSSVFIIRCVMCKTQFDQAKKQTRFCEECRSLKSRQMRQKYNQKRRDGREKIRKGVII
jgi:rRNA maturation endonuclease Nob1